MDWNVFQRRFILYLFFITVQIYFNAGKWNYINLRDGF
jgi:hypothetical protein